MGRVRIKSSWHLANDRLPAISDALGVEVQNAVDDMGDDLAQLIESTMWVDTGVAKRTVEVEDGGAYTVHVNVGYYLGRGFYVGFHEFGTHKMGPRPVVRPAAHQAEPIFASYVERAIKRAAEA